MSQPADPATGQPPDLMDATVQARNFQRVREARQAEIAEDYVELIAELAREQGAARASDLAQRLGVSNATVTNTVQRLARAGLIDNRPYTAVTLTRAGHEMAQASRARHLLVREMLIALGVPPDIAEADTEGMEHHVSPQTLAAFRRFLDTR